MSTIYCIREFYINKAIFFLFQSYDITTCDCLVAMLVLGQHYNDDTVAELTAFNSSPLASGWHHGGYVKLL